MPHLLGGPGLKDVSVKMNGSFPAGRTTLEVSAARAMHFQRFTHLSSCLFVQKPGCSQIASESNSVLNLNLEDSSMRSQIMMTLNHFLFFFPKTTCDPLTFHEASILKVKDVINNCSFQRALIGSLSWRARNKTFGTVPERDKGSRESLIISELTLFGQFDNLRESLNYKLEGWISVPFSKGFEAFEAFEAEGSKRRWKGVKVLPIFQALFFAQLSAWLKVQASRG